MEKYFLREKFISLFFFLLFINPVQANTSSFNRLESGKVMCWGCNHFGLLGNGSTNHSSSPVAVNTKKLGTEVVSIVGGSAHSCALKQTGHVMCWGYNALGQLGNGHDGSFNFSTIPVDVLHLEANVVSITAGGYHTCALKKDGQLMCWGSNSDGALGNQSTASSNIPVAVMNDELGADIHAVTAGNAHTCALKSMGEIMCWGQNWFGQLGNGQGGYFHHSTIPVAVVHQELGTDIIAITSGGFHTCALKKTGQVFCWGANEKGQLGNNTHMNNYYPVEVVNDELGLDVVAIAAGNYHTCALKRNGHIMCWGENTEGQLGNNTTRGSSVPVHVVADELGVNISAIMCGNEHSCALKKNGQLMCWGKNMHGQLGNGKAGEGVYSSVPVSVKKGYFNSLSLMQHNLSFSSCVLVANKKV